MEPVVHNPQGSIVDVVSDRWADAAHGGWADLASEVVVVPGEEVARLRAEVIRRRAMVTVLEHQRGG